MQNPRVLRPIADPPGFARHIFSLIASELELAEKELEFQGRSSVQIISSLNNYLRLSGGKRIRPALTILSNHLVGAGVSRSVIRMAAVMEFLHAATLVHDDIIDNATTRRNRPSINNRHGNRMAVRLGDWLYLSAFETSLAERSLKILDILTDVTRKMVEGELMQLGTKGRTDITEELYLDILQRKTAYLFSASCEIGAILGKADADQQRALKLYGMYLGITFQLIDDLLDFTSSTELLGKACGADLLEGKLTLPLIYLLESDPSMSDALQTVMMGGNYQTVPRQTLLHAIKRHNTLARAFKRAREYAEAACKCLEAFSSSPYRETLLTMPALILGRSY